MNDKTKQTSTPPVEEMLPFELIIGEDDGKILNGDVPVRWCISSELVTEMETKGIIDPHVLLVTVDKNGREMDRKLSPITELKTYVRFTKAGKSRILGFVLEGNAGRKELTMFTRKTDGDWHTSILGYSGEIYDSISHEYARTEESIIIPEGVFGVEPGPFMKWFVNLWHGSKNRIVDECHYRKRKILAVTLKWMPVLVFYTSWVLLRFISTILLIGGGFRVQMKKFGRIFNPHKYNDVSMHVWDGGWEAKENWMLVKRKRFFRKDYQDKDDRILMFFTLAINPIILLAMFIVGGAFVASTVSELVMFMTIISTIILIVTGLIDTGTIFGEWASTTPFWERMGNRIDKWAYAIRDFTNAYINLTYVKYALYAIGLYFIGLVLYKVGLEIAIITGFMVVLGLAVLFLENSILLIEKMINFWTVSPEANDYSDIRELLCPKDETNLRTASKFIPQEKRTIRLYYLDLKNKMCKPMQM